MCLPLSPKMPSPIVSRSASTIASTSVALPAVLSYVQIRHRAFTRAFTNGVGSAHAHTRPARAPCSSPSPPRPAISSTLILESPVSTFHLRLLLSASSIARFATQFMLLPVQLLALAAAVQHFFAGARTERVGRVSVDAATRAHQLSSKTPRFTAEHSATLIFIITIAPTIVVVVVVDSSSSRESIPFHTVDTR